MDMLHSATVLMVAAVIVVSIFKKIGLGSILGYIVAGLIIGPWGLDLIANTENILQFSEIGVVFLLFIIGLEMNPARLRVLKRFIFGLGVSQVLITTLILTVPAYLVLNSWVTATVVGFGLSLSSTAFGLQLIAERNELSSPHGRAALHILLLQDLAVIPVLALIPIIAVDEINSGADIAGGIFKTIGILIIFWLFARFLLRPMLRFVAAIRVHEIFISAALLLVLGSALVMEAVGISMVLGAFLAGVLVADSEYRHQLESDIEPFKGLLLGLFFIAVGMSANLGLLIEQTTNVVVIVIGIIFFKSIVLYVLGRITKLNSKESLLLSACLNQGGEFGFILFTLAAGHHLMTVELKDLMIVAVTLSMTITPLILFLTERGIRKLSRQEEKPEYDDIDSTEPKVIVAGFGRFGQIISRMIRTQDMYFTAIEIDPHHVDFVRRLGNKVYYGDASQKQLLDIAGTKKAEVFVLAIGHIETSLKIAGLVKHEYPNIKLYARAHTRMHEMQLRAVGADVIIRDTLLSSMHLAEKILLSLGLSLDKAAYVKQRFYQHDADTLNKQYAYRGDQKMLIKTSYEAAQELEELFAEDKMNYSKNA